MPVSLQKGGNVSLTKEAGGTLKNISVGLGWDARTTDGQAFDLDAVAMICGANGKVLTPDNHFIFFNKLSSDDGTVVHMGDNLTGEGDGDDEVIKINLEALPTEVDKVAIGVAIFGAEENGQAFGQVRNAFIRVTDDATGTELARYDLSEDYATETALLFGEVYRHGTDFKFRAEGQGWTSGLRGLATDFGVAVG